jgi:hypothetical protein
MTTRLLIALLAFASLALSQQLPSYQWMKELDASGTDSLAGLGTDAPQEQRRRPHLLLHHPAECSGLMDRHPAE